MFSISFFNFAGISVTQYLSATTRTVLDSIRTVVVKACALWFGWEGFSWIQLGGFLVLIMGMMIYNDILFRPLYVRLTDRADDDEIRVVISEPDDNAVHIDDQDAPNRSRADPEA